MDPGWAGVIPGALSLAVAALSLYRMDHRSHRQSRLAMGYEATELRNQLVLLRALCREIVADGGQRHVMLPRSGPQAGCL